jgi:hypothetical protein
MTKLYTKIKFRKFKPNYTPIDETEKHKNNADKLITMARLMLLAYAFFMAMDIATSSLNIIASLGLWLILK